MTYLIVQFVHQEVNMSHGMGNLVPAERERVHVYIDETGDRGAGPRSSPIFGLSAVLLDSEGVPRTQEAVRLLRSDFSVPVGRPVMSWKDDAKTHDRRRRAAEILGRLPGVRICYVYAVKQDLPPDSFLRSAQLFYDHLAFEVYKSVLTAATLWKGMNVEVFIRFGHVRGQDHRLTAEFFDKQAMADLETPFRVRKGLKWVAADRYLESQAADLYGGFLKSALWPGGQFGFTYPEHLLTVWAQLSNSEACVIPMGFNALPDPRSIKSEPWFPCENVQHERLARSLRGAIH